MRTSPRRLVLLGIVAVVLAVVAAVLVIVTRSDSHRSFVVGRTTIGGDVPLSADVHPSSTGTRSPLVVMPSPFGADIDYYDKLAGNLARRGYQVVSYVQRGFHDSGGDVDLAGAGTQSDVSRVITWALAHTDADPDHVGLLGISYGAGNSLLAAARDPRVRAVAALSTWTDFAESFDPDHTPALASIGELLPQTTGRLDPSLAALASSATSATAFGPALRAISAARSPQTVVNPINKNGTAIFIANGFGDRLFAPAQLITFFDDLTVPKHLQLAPGDHGGPESTALDGSRDNVAMTAAFAWLDHYLRGRPAQTGPYGRPVTLVDEITGTPRGYASWPATSTTPIPLGAPDTANNVGTAAAWTAPLGADRDSGADVAQGTTTVDPATWDAGAVLAWAGTPFTTDTALSGTTQLHVDVTSSATSATLFTYLYDVDADGKATLMTGQPWTATDLAPGTARSVTIDLQPIAWTMQTGHHLVLAVDTADPRYGSPTPAGTTVTLSSTAADPATVTVPIEQS